jgi:hypothetical protein
MTIRDDLQQEILYRIEALPGYVAARRQPGEGDANVSKLACLLEVSEQVLGSDTMLVTKQLSLEVLVQVRAQDATGAVGANGERYLLDELARVEGAIFTPAWLPSGDQIKPQGSRVVPEDTGTLLRGIITLSVVYRHNIGDPSTFNPMVIT